MAAAQPPMLSQSNTAFCTHDVACRRHVPVLVGMGDGCVEGKHAAR